MSCDENNSDDCGKIIQADCNSETILPQISEVECKKDESPKLTDATSTKNPESSANEKAVRKLVKEYPIQCSKTDTFAVNYLLGLHHPVISCFREVKKADLSTLFSNNKWKHHIKEPLEQSIVYMGLIDYIATVINNPLYDENFSKSFSSKALRTVQKILMEFKSMIANWSLSDDGVLNNRCETIMRHLRHLVPMFAAAKQDLGGVLDCIESDILRMKTNKGLKKTGSVEIKDERKIFSVESPVDDRFALEEIILNSKADGTDEKLKTAFLSPANSTPSSKSKQGKKTPLRQTSKSPKVTNLGSKQLTKGKDKSPFTQNKKPSVSSKRPISVTNSPLNELPNKKIKTDGNDANAKKTTAETVSDSVTTNTQVNSPVVNNTIASERLHTVNGVQKINAFAILMNKSREIAQGKKVKRIAAEAKIATQTVS